MIPVNMMQLTGNRNLHIEVPKTSYIKLKIATFERQLTIQDVFAGFVALVASQDDKAFKILDELALMKFQGKLKTLTAGPALSDVSRDLLYDLIESQGTEEV